MIHDDSLLGVLEVPLRLFDDADTASASASDAFFGASPHHKASSVPFSTTTSKVPSATEVHRHTFSDVETLVGM